jgi:hypothetical protein
MRIRAGRPLLICGLTLLLLGGAAASPRAGGGDRLPPPSLRPSSAWLAVTTGSLNMPNLAPTVWALTARSNLAALAPFDPNALRHLSRGAALVSATTSGRGGPNLTFRPSSWPLRLARFQVNRSWEGQPAANVQQRLRWVAVRGWHLDVRVYFATQHPGKPLLHAVQQELDRLVLPNRG